MLRLDWGNPKISTAELEAFLSNYLTTQYDGLLQENNYLFIVVHEPLNGDQEDHILNYIYSINDITREVITQADKVSPKDSVGSAYIRQVQSRGTLASPTAVSMMVVRLLVIVMNRQL